MWKKIEEVRKISTVKVCMRERKSEKEILRENERERAGVRERELTRQ